MEFVVVKLNETKRVIVPLPRLGNRERSVGWISRFRHLARYYERLPETPAGLCYLAFIVLMLKNVAESSVDPCLEINVPNDSQPIKTEGENNR